MKEPNKIRSKWLTIRLNEDEEKKLNQLYSRSTCNAISEYARAVLLREPVNILYRNQTADEFLQEMIQMKKELNAIGNNFNQAVHKLHSFDHHFQIKAWAILNETYKKTLTNKTNEIMEKISEIYTLWSQK